VSDEKPKPSWGNIGEHHWTRAREGMNEEDFEYFRERSKAPGVREGGGARNHYCMQCNGVVPLEYDQRDPASTIPEHCPHCGAELDARVRAMFNWVEIDQPPDSDLKALALPALGVLLLLAGVVALFVWWLG
jgi:hypothetical protein